MNLFQLYAFVGFIGCAMAGVCHGKHDGFWGSVLGGFIGGVAGFVGGIIMTPVVMLIGYVMEGVDRRLGHPLRRKIVFGSKRPKETRGADDTK